MAKNDIDDMLDDWFAKNPINTDDEALATDEEAEEKATETEDAPEEETATEEENTASEGDDEGETVEEEETEAEESATETAAEDDDAEETEADEENEAKTATETKRDAQTMMSEDIAEFNRLYPKSQIKSIDDIPNAVDFAKMRMSGISVEDAARYVMGTRQNASAKSSGKDHLTASVPKQTASSTIEGMTQEEYAMARSVFGDMSKKDIERLYKRTKST